MLKQIIVIRKNHSLSPLQLATRISKAAVKTFTDRIRINSGYITNDAVLDLNMNIEGKIYLTERMRLWMKDSFKKEIYEVKDEKELEELFTKISKTNISVTKIEDVCLSIGPDHWNRIKETIGDLKCLEK